MHLCVVIICMQYDEECFLFPSWYDVNARVMSPKVTMTSTNVHKPASEEFQFQHFRAKISLKLMCLFFKEKKILYSRINKRFRLIDSQPAMWITRCQISFAIATIRFSVFTKSQGALTHAHTHTHARFTRTRIVCAYNMDTGTHGLEAALSSALGASEEEYGDGIFTFWALIRLQG